MPTVNDPPPGWTSKAEDIEKEDKWDGEDSDGQDMCQQMGLGTGHPIMFNRKSCGFLFEASGKFYLWYSVGNDLLEITSPKTLNGIINTMKEKGVRAVRTKRL